MRIRSPVQEARNSLTFWVVTLETARERGDRRRERLAIRELRKRGVTVAEHAAQPAEREEVSRGQ